MKTLLCYVIILETDESLLVIKTEEKSGSSKIKISLQGGTLPNEYYKNTESAPTLW